MDTPDSTTLKRCSTCGETKLRDQFGKDKSRADGLRLSCKDCIVDRDRQYRERHHEAVIERKRQYRTENREHEQEYARQYRAENREQELERSRRWRAENTERSREYNRKYYAAHPEKAREYRERHREAIQERQRQRHAMNPDIRRATANRRRVRKKQAGGACTATELVAIRVAQTDKNGRLICWACGRPIMGTPHLDHWIPIDKQGTSDAGNLHFMHAKCNQSKSAKHPFELGRLL